MRALSYAPDAWKYLNGVFCVYKPTELFTIQVQSTLKLNLCRGLNEMETRPVQNRVELKGSVISGKPFSVELAPNYADHKLVSGPRYQIQDLRISPVSRLGKYTCGVLPMAINDACGPSHNLRRGNFLGKYEVKGMFGKASQTCMADGKIMERSSYYHIRQAALDRLLASIQVSHQALAYQYAGIDSQSQAAYELASKGTIRPGGKSKPIIYGMKCTEFNLPEFTIEIQCINETEDYLAGLVHEIGVYLRSSAVCTHLRRTQFGHFTIDHALLRKHWTLENILSNITLCKTVVGNDYAVPSSAHFEPIKMSTLKETIQDMQTEARDDEL